MRNGSIDDPPSDAGWHDALRVQAAAVVAQQAALVEHELRLREREAALARQEEQIAAHLDEKRRLALELQDQIAAARAKLRQKRAAHAELAAQQAAELAKARDEAADLLGAARAQRQRIALLSRKLRVRWRRERHAGEDRLRAARAELNGDRERLDAERAGLFAEAARANGDVELKRRQLQAWQEQLDDERREWSRQRDAEEAERRLKLRDLARRSKAVAAEEARLAAEKHGLGAALRDRRREVDHLETRVVNLRQKLLDGHGQLLHAAPPAAPAVAPDEAHRQRAALLKQVADDLADQRLTIAEQAARLLRTQLEWAAEREKSRAELDDAAAGVQQHAQELLRRARDLNAAEARSQAEYDALHALRLRIDAERAVAESRLADRDGEQGRRAAALVARERRLDARAAAWADLWRTWGRRRSAELDRLREAREACRAERAEWAAARAVWLRAGTKLQEERRAVAAQAGALEQWRREAFDDIDNPAAAERRIERLRRQWDGYCSAASRDLDRLRATLAAEAARLDEHAVRLQSADRALDVRIARSEAMAAEQERRQAALADETSRNRERIGLARARWEAAERRVAGLRGEVESLARLLIDSGGSPVSQAA